MARRRICNCAKQTGTTKDAGHKKVSEDPMSIRFVSLSLALILALAAAATSLVAQQTPAQGTHVQDSVRSKELNTQAYIQLLHTDLSAKQEQIVRETMQLNDQQAAIFWPIYREYQSEQSKLTADKLALVADYSRNFSTMTDEKADIGASDRKGRAQQRNRPPQHARPSRTPAQAQHDHRAIEFDAERP